MTDLHEQIRKALAVLPPITSGVCDGQTEVCIGKWMLYLGFDAESAAIGDALTSAPQWLAALLDDVKTLTAERDRYLHALELVAPDGRGLQLFLGEGPAPGMPMYGSVCTESPYLIATKPEGPDESFAGAREVYQYTHDEDTQHEAESCTVGYFVTEDWLCERDEGAEEKYDEALARAERAEKALAEVDMILNVVGADADFRRKLLCATRARLEAAETERSSLLAENARLRAEASSARRDAETADESWSEAQRERDSARDLAVHRGEQIQRLQGEIAQHLAFRAEVNDALPRPFGVTVIGAIKALRAEVDARPAITREDAALVKDYGDMYADKVKAWMPRAVHAALRAHASQPQCFSCHGTRTVMDADHDSRVLTADDCPACSQPKGDGGCDA